MVGPVNVVTAIPMPCVESSRETDFWPWYWEILEMGEMTDKNAPSPGCYILKVRTYWKNPFPSYSEPNQPAIVPMPASFLFTLEEYM